MCACKYVCRILAGDRWLAIHLRLFLGLCVRIPFIRYSLSGLFVSFVDLRVLAQKHNLLAIQLDLPTD